MGIVAVGSVLPFFAEDRTEQRYPVSHASKREKNAENAGCSAVALVASVRTPRPSLESRLTPTMLRRPPTTPERMDGRHGPADRRSYRPMRRRLAVTRNFPQGEIAVGCRLRESAFGDTLRPQYPPRRFSTSISTTVCGRRRSLKNLANCRKKMQPLEVFLLSRIPEIKPALGQIGQKNRSIRCVLFLSSVHPQEAGR